MIRIQIDNIGAFLYNAGYKARIDCRNIFSELGFKELNVESFNDKRNRVHNFIVFFYLVTKMIICLMVKTIICFASNQKTVLIIQYPQYALAKSRSLIFRIIHILLKGEIILFIHDIESFRNNYPISNDSDLDYLLKVSDYIILHTENMKDRLIRESNVDVKKIKILGPFDYLTNDNITIEKTIRGNKVIFAGNLNKSEFISKLGEIENITFNLYGKIDNKEILSKNAKYKGFFDPNKISSLEGDWGLVWDGNSINKCSGILGEYLKYNSPHKFSLYIAAGIPVIVWKESGLSKYVEENKIGITVDKLSDIGNILTSMTEIEKEEIKHNVSILSSKLRSGYYTKKVILDILYSL